MIAQKNAAPIESTRLTGQGVQRKTGAAKPTTMSETAKLNRTIETGTETGFSRPALKRLLVAFFVSVFFFYGHAYATAFTTEASWYSVESCKREGTWQKYGGRCADGSMFDDRLLTCASWDFPLGTKVRVTSEDGKKSIICKVTDRGPSRKLYKRGRRIDLSRGAFSQVADLRWGITRVIVETL